MRQTDRIQSVGLFQTKISAKTLLHGGRMWLQLEDLVLLDVAAPCIRTVESKQERYLGTCKYITSKQLIKVFGFIIFSTKVGTDYCKIVK